MNPAADAQEQGAGARQALEHDEREEQQESRGVVVRAVAGELDEAAASSPTGRARAAGRGRSSPASSSDRDAELLQARIVHRQRTRAAQAARTGKAARPDAGPGCVRVDRRAAISSSAALIVWGTSEAPTAELRVAQLDADPEQHDQAPVAQAGSGQKQRRRGQDEEGEAAVVRLRPSRQAAWR